MSINRPSLHRIEEVVSKTPRIAAFRFRSPRIAEEARPGQFVMVWAPGVDEIPISVAHAESDFIEIAIADVGDCSHRLHQLGPGELVGLRGPYGSGFEVGGGRLCLVGGGYGSAPLRFLAERLAGKGEIVVLLGAKTSAELLYGEEFEEAGCEVQVSTEDGSAGRRGLVTELLSELLGERRVDQVLTCGPELMMEEVCRISEGAGVPVQVCVERYMKCAVGVCGSCDCGGIRVCSEGPVLDYRRLRGTEFGLWRRDKSGRRVPVRGELVELPPPPPREPERDPLLEVEVCGIRLPNPIMNASGSAVSGRALYRIAAEGGAGAVVTKSVSLAPKEGYSNPTFLEESPGSWVNAMGLPNPGVEEYGVEVGEALRSGVPVIASVFGRNPLEFAAAAKRMEEFGASAIELNVSCPHVEGGALEERPEEVQEVAREVKSRVSIPVFVKVSTNADYIRVVEAALDGGADGVTAINTVKTPCIEPSLGIPALGNPAGYGGRSGVALKPLVRRVVSEVYGRFGVPVLAAGGIDSPEDVLELARLGASGFQICTAIREGLSVFRRIREGARGLLEKGGYGNIRDVIGAGQRR